MNPSGVTFAGFAATGSRSLVAAKADDPAAPGSNVAEVAAPVDTVRFTAEPAATLALALGLWLITPPEGTVELDAVVTVPTVRPALVIAVVAADCESPTTLGTVTGAGPDDMLRFTAEPAATLALALGLWLITSPEGTLELDAVVTVPTVRPAPVIVVVAADCEIPTTLGTVTSAGPDDTVRFTAEPAATLALALGLWLITLPEDTVELDAVVTVPTVRPAPVIAVVAADCEIPTTLGTVTGAGPDDTVRLTVLPEAALAPAEGLWLITLPEGTVELLALVTVPSVNFAPVIALVAAAWVRPTTFGTVT
jgi:hypothetical protein